MLFQKVKERHPCLLTCMSPLNSINLLFSSIVVSVTPEETVKSWTHALFPPSANGYVPGSAFHFQDYVDEK